MKQEMWTTELRGWLDLCARQAGFDSAGVAAVRDEDDPEAAQEAKRYAAWVEAGRAGEMEYLKRRDEAGVLVRGSLRVAMPWARSVIVCALNYNAEAPRSIDAAEPGARAGSRALCVERPNPRRGKHHVPTDYHDELLLPAAQHRG